MKMMKLGQNGMRTALLALCTLAVSAAPALAQDTPPPPPQAGQGQMGGGHRGEMMQERQLDHMTKVLKLTPDQVTQVKSIQDNSRQQMMALRQDQSGDRRSKMMSIRQDEQSKIRGVLTDDQKPKYDEMLAKEKERMQERRGGGSPDAPPAPPQN